MLRLSGVAEPMQTIQAFIAYFKQFIKEFQAYQERLDQRLATLRQDDATIEPLRQEVRQRYVQIVQEVSVIGGVHAGSDEEAAE
jgi:DNA repair ATPase RecN